MDVVNATERNIGYKVTSSSTAELTRFGTPEAAEEDVRAELNIQFGRYETFPSVQELVEALRYEGDLDPHTYIHLVAPAKPFKVNFFESGRLIATVSFTETPDTVVLHEGGGRLRADAVCRNTQRMSHAR